MSNTIQQRINHYTTTAKSLNLNALQARVNSYTCNEYKLEKQDMEIRALCMYEAYKSVGGLDSNVQNIHRINDLIDRYSTLDTGKFVDEGKGEEPEEEFDLDYIIANRYLSMSQRSKKKGLDFNLTLNDIKRMIKRKKCEYTGEEISIYHNQDHPNKLTFDRINNKKGYVKGNVAVFANWINEAKSDMFEDDKAPFALDNFDDAIKILMKINKMLKNAA